MKAFSRKDLRHPIRAPGRSSAITLRRNVRHRKRGDRQPARFEVRGVWETIPLPPFFLREARFDFRAGLPDASLFPHRTWRRVIARALRSREMAAGAYENPAGNWDLRAAIARHIGISRSVSGSPDDIIVTNGTQQALDIIARVLLEPGDAVAVEKPGYLPPKDLFKALGARVIGVPVDSEGLVVEALPAEAKVVYVTPSHQFPLGVAMSLSRRRALLAWAERNNAVVVEDDYDSEFRFGGRPLEPLQTIDSTGRVVYVGTFSKTLLPSSPAGLHGRASVAARSSAQGEVRHRLAYSDNSAERAGAVHRRGRVCSPHS